MSGPQVSGGLLDFCSTAVWAIMFKCMYEIKVTHTPTRRHTVGFWSVAWAHLWSQMIGTKWMSKHKAHTVSWKPDTHPWMHSNSRHNTPPCPPLSTKGGVKGPVQPGAVNTFLHLLPPTRLLTNSSQRAHMQTEFHTGGVAEMLNGFNVTTRPSCSASSRTLTSVPWFSPANQTGFSLRRRLRREIRAIKKRFLPAPAECEWLLQYGSCSAVCETVLSRVNLTNANSEEQNKTLPVEITHSDFIFLLRHRKLPESCQEEEGAAFLRFRFS